MPLFASAVGRAATLGIEMTVGCGVGSGVASRADTEPCSLLTAGGDAIKATWGLVGMGLEVMDVKAGRREG